MKNWWTKRHVHPCNGASIFGGLALRIVEICGDSNDGMLHFFAQVVLRRLLVENEMKMRPTEQTQNKLSIPKMTFSLASPILLRDQEACDV